MLQGRGHFCPFATTAHNDPKPLSSRSLALFGPRPSHMRPTLRSGCIEVSAGRRPQSSNRQLGLVRHSTIWGGYDFKVHLLGSLNWGLFQASPYFREPLADFGLSAVRANKKPAVASCTISSLGQHRCPSASKTDNFIKCRACRPMLESVPFGASKNQSHSAISTIQTSSATDTSKPKATTPETSVRSNEGDFGLRGQGWMHPFPPSGWDVSQFRIL